MEKYVYNLENINVIKRNEGIFLKLEGWILHNSNENKLLVKIDSKEYDLEFNKYRQDVNDSYNISEKLKLGFDYELEISKFNKIELKIYTNKSQQTLIKKINFKSVLFVNENVNYNFENIKLKDSEVKIMGWAINKSIKKKVELVVKNEKGKILYDNFTNIKRVDVINFFSNEKLEYESGFNIDLKLDNKTREIIIYAKEDDFYYKLRTIEIPIDENMNPIMKTININMRLIKKGIKFIIQDKNMKSINIKECIKKYKSALNDEYSKTSKNFSVSKNIDAYEKWIQNNSINKRHYEFMERDISNFTYTPTISILMPIWNVEEIWLEKAIQSVINQSYKNWELCMVDDKSTKSYIRPYLEKVAKEEERVKIKFREENGNISACTNTAFEISTGEYILLMDNDDELTPNALYEIAKCLQNENRPDIIYSDDDKIDENGHRYAPQFKPDWSPELLLSFMYFSHIFCFSRKTYSEVGGCRIGFEGCQDYDLALRMTELTNNIKHIDKVLYHWRSIEGSTAQDGNAKPEAFERGIRAVQEALERRGIDGKVIRPDYAIQSNLGIFSIDFPNDGPEVSIVIPTKNQKELLKRCVDSIVNKTTYKNYKIVIINNDSDEEEMIKYLAELRSQHTVLDIHNRNNKFSYAYINNQAVSMIESEYVLLLNNDTEVISNNWLSNMMGYGKIDDIGIVGARLLFPDNRVQHAGVVLGLYNGMVAPAFKLLPDYNLGYFNFAKVSRNYSCVTAACMLIKRDLFNKLNGFDEEKFAVAYNDVDLCIRCLNSGKRIVYAPEAELYHYEGATRGFVDNIDEILNYKSLYGNYVDKYYNKNLSLYDEQFNISSDSTLGYNSSLEDKTIAFATHNLNFEGAPLHLYELVKGFKQKTNNFKATVISPINGPLKEMYEKIGVEVQIIEYNIYLNSYKESYDNCINKITEYIKKKDFHLIYANTLETFLFIDIANDLNIPSIWNIHESVDYKNYFEEFDTYVQRRYLNCFITARKVIFVCDATLRIYSDMNMVNNFDYIYNGIDKKSIDIYKDNLSKEHAKSKLEIPKEAKVITIVGTVCERKGQLDFVSAAINIIKKSKEEVRFIVVGCRKNDYLDKIKEMINNNDLEDKILLIKETNDVNLYYRASDIFVCASYNESFPRVTLEAMAFDLPIVTTDVFGLKEQIIENVNGLYFKPGDVDKLESNLIGLLSNDSMYTKFGTNSSKVLKMLNSHEQMIDKYLQIITKNI